MRLALVTGATGGLGCVLVPHLRQAGWRVRGTGREAAAMPACEAVLADLVEPLPAGLLDGVDTVFHLAARSSPWGPRAEFRAINVDVTARLLAAAQAAGCRRFVHVSTPSIYAEQRDRIALTEASPPARRFANAYAETKYAGEQAVLAADSPAMRTVVIRPRAIVAPGERVLLPRLLRAVRRGRVALPRGGEALIELTDARDVAAALIAAAEVEEAGGRALNISGGEPRPLRRIVELVAAALGRPIRIGSISTPLAFAAARAAEWAGALTGREPVLTRYAVTALGWSQTFDLSAARAVLGWTPRSTPEAAIAHALGTTHA